MNNIEKLDTLKAQYAYDGKPKQWQQGFDSMAKEYEELLRAYNSVMLVGGQIALDYINMDSTGPREGHVKLMLELYAQWSANNPEAMPNDEFLKRIGVA